MSAIFAYAVSERVLVSNPVSGKKPGEGAAIPHSAKPASATYAYGLREVLAMLKALRGRPKARATVALMFFCGLRPEEAKGLRWEDYDPAAVYDSSKQQL